VQALGEGRSRFRPTSHGSRIGLRIAAKAVEKLGRIDVVRPERVSCPPYELVEEASLDNWRKIFEVNVFGSIALVQAVLPQMKAQGRGAIRARELDRSASSSRASRLCRLEGRRSRPPPDARTRARQPAGIRVNSVVPGTFWGPNVQAYFRKLAKGPRITPEAVYEEVAGLTARILQEIHSNRILAMPLALELLHLCVRASLALCELSSAALEPCERKAVLSTESLALSP